MGGHYRRPKVQSKKGNTDGFKDVWRDFSGGLVVKNSPSNSGDVINPWSGN